MVLCENRLVSFLSTSKYEREIEIGFLLVNFFAFVIFKIALLNHNIQHQLLMKSLQIVKKTQLTGHNAGIYALVMDEDNRHFYSGAGDGWVVRWDLEAPEIGKLIAKVEANIFSLLLLHQHQQLIAGNMEGGIHWIDLNAPENTKNIAHHKKGVYAMLHIDSFIFTAGGDGVITKWSIAKMQSLESIQLTYSSIRSLDYSLVRNEIVVGASDNNIYFLDATTLALKRTIPNAHASSVFVVKYAPDQTTLWSGGRDAHLKIWDLATNHLLFSESAHWFTINDIQFHPQGHLAATASRDKTVKIWQTKDYQLVKVLETFRDQGHVNSVNRLLWTSYPHQLLSCSDDRSIIIWEL